MSALANADESDDEVEVPPLAEPEAGKASVSSTVVKGLNIVRSDLCISALFSVGT